MIEAQERVITNHQTPTLALNDAQERMSQNHQASPSTNPSEGGKDYVLCYQIDHSFFYYHAEHPRTTPPVPQARRVLLVDLVANTICGGCKQPLK